MQATLTRSASEHRWQFADCRITQVCVDPSSIRLQAWTLEASLEVRFGAPLTIRPPDGQVLQADVEQPGTAAPLLALIGQQVEALTVTRAGSLSLEVSDGTLLSVDSHPRYEAFEVIGGGHWETLGYLASPGGGSPWG